MSEPLARRLPSPLALFLAALAAVAVALAFIKGLQDPDFFWHYMNGRLVAAGAMPVADQFSFTAAGEHRTPHEWLSEWLMYVLVDGIGPDATLAIFALALPVGFVALAFSLRRAGLGTLPIALTLSLAAAVAIPYATVRPQVLSWMLLGVLVALLLAVRPQRPWPVLLAIPIIGLWANLHGLWAVGFATLGWFALWTLFGRTQVAARRGWVLAALVGAFLAAMIAPDGPANVLYPLRFLNAGDWGLANIPEWRSPNFHDVVQWPLLLLIVVVALVAGRGAPGWVRGLAYIGVVMALIANRNAPVAAVFAAPAVAMGLQAQLARGGAGTRTDVLGRRLLEAGVAAVIVIGALSSVPSNVKGIQLGRYPVDGVAVLERENPDARALVEYGWGGYVIYRLHDDGARVFVDGRNDFYPTPVLEDYSALRAAAPGWEEIAERYGIEAILFRPDATIVKGPAEQAGWCEAHRDEGEVLLLPCAESSSTGRPDRW